MVACVLLWLLVLQIALHDESLVADDVTHCLCLERGAFDEHDCARKARHAWVVGVSTHYLVQYDAPQILHDDRATDDPAS